MRPATNTLLLILMTTPATANPAFEIVTAPALPSALVRAPVADGAGGVYVVVKDKGVAHVRQGRATMLDIGRKVR